MARKIDKQKKLAVLVDAENAKYSIIEGLLDEIATYGIASVKRVYGDWTDHRLSGWKATLLDFGIQPIQQFAYTKGKNSSDSAMIIDAMDLLYTRNFDGFCIVSSDSDFTRLALRIRESGLLVYGFGEKKTPVAFSSACDKFIYIENLREGTTIKSSDIQKPSSDNLLDLLKYAVEDTVDDSGWSNLGAVGQKIANKMSDFDPRNYGYKKLVDLLESTKSFEIKYSDPLSQSNIVQVRRKKSRDYTQ
ncbi:MAG: NYN domain-containing protein [Campylobacterota bacterium]|nr:NYN domain-containing protein [Campylobacterota bacterium]